MVAPVREARERGVLKTVRPFTRFTEHGVMWDEDIEELVDVVVWCTGFKSALDHLAPLGVIKPDGRILVEGTRSIRESMRWLAGMVIGRVTRQAL
jgi:hypothetical protein